jgi:hypothetical protein
MTQIEERHSAFMEKVRCWRRIFLADDGSPSVDAGVVLEDLKKFCHAEATTHCFDAHDRLDALASAQLEGRRQVWMRINGYLSKSEGELSLVQREFGGVQ